MQSEIITIKTANRSFENIAKLKYLGTSLSIHLSLYLPVRLSIYLYVQLFLSNFTAIIYLYVYLFISNFAAVILLPLGDQVTCKRLWIVRN
jgi:hypothetical protein